MMIRNILKYILKVERQKAAEHTAGLPEDSLLPIEKEHRWDEVGKGCDNDKGDRKMKKIFTIMMVLMVATGLGFAHASAQTWTWEDPVLTSTPVLEIAGDPASDAIYGINLNGEVFPIPDVQTVMGTAAPEGSLWPVKDLVFGFESALYAISDGAVMQVNPGPPLSYTPLYFQPRIPADDAKGSYMHIASGVDGKLYVLFQAVSGYQYLLVGMPPVTQGVLTVNINPQTLNIKSKGNWVSCHIALAVGYKATEIDIASIRITRLEIPGVAPIDYDIFRAPSSPLSVNLYGLNLKFLNYDRANPVNPQSLNWQLSTMLTDAQKGKYEVTATVLLRMKDGLHKGEWLSGTATFDALKPTNK